MSSTCGGAAFARQKGLIWILILLLILDLSLSFHFDLNSILGPLMLSRYLLFLGQIFWKHGLSYHCYANDTGIDFPLGHDGLQPLFDCLDSKGY